MTQVATPEAMLENIFTSMRMIFSAPDLSRLLKAVPTTPARRLAKWRYVLIDEPEKGFSEYWLDREGIIAAMRRDADSV